MPFQSEKQRRYLWANEPEIAREWTDRYGANQGGIMRVPFYEGTDVDDTMFSGIGKNFSDLDFNFINQAGATTNEGINTEGLSTDVFESPTAVSGTDFGNTDFWGNPVVDEEVVSTSFADHPNFMSWWNANPQMGENITQKAKEFYEKGKSGINWAGKAAMAGLGKAVNLPLNLLSGIASFRNPLNPNSANYNWDLAGQIKNLNTRGMLGDQSSPYKITSGPLRGKNLVSMFGTNDYAQMLQKRIDYFNKQKAKKGKLFTDEQQRRLEEAEEKKRIADEQAAARAAQQVQQNIQTYGGGDRPDTGMNAPGGGRGQSPTGGNVAGTPFAQGGLAGLWHRK